MLSLAGLDLRCPVDLAGLVANGNCSGGAGIEGNLTTTLTALTVLQLRNAGQLATLRQLPRLEVVDLWCCDGSWHNGMTYWMSAAPQRIRRGLPLLATALTALTALVLRELEAQVEPPPPVAALATLPLLRSFKLELVYDDPWRELAELAEQLEEDEDHFEDGSEAGEEDRQVADPLKTAETMEGKEEGRKTVAGDTAAAAPAPGEILDSCIQRDSRMLDRRGPLIEGVVGLSWRHLRDSRPLDLFSCFGDKYDGDRSDASDRGTEMSAATNTGGVLTRASLTELDVTFLGAGLLPGAWHGISQLGSGLTRLALRVGRSPLEERLISNLQARTPGRWPPGSFSVHSLESLPHLRHLLLDVPLESHLAAGLAARALNLSAGMLPSLQRSQEWPSLTIPSGLESLALVGMWTRAGCPGAAAAPSAAWVAAEAAGTCGRTEAVQLPLASIPLLPVRTMLRTVHLDGDLRHLVSDITGKVLCGLDLVDLRLAHRPAGRPFQRSCNGGNDDPVRNRKLLHGRLQLLWTQLPSNLQLLDVEGFHVHIDDTSHGDSALECKTDLPTFGGHPAYVGGMPSSRYLERLERLRLRHCAATLDGVYYCPLGEVAVQGCWLIPTKAVTMPTGTAPATEAVTPSPPWDATGQLQLLCQQPWASRLLRLDLQFIRLPCNLEVRVATAGPVGQGSWPCGSRPCNSTDGAVTVEYALPGAACTTRLCGLEHLSITWELEALSPGRRAERNAAIPTDQGPLAPCVGLPPDLASHLVASLPDGLRSLELYLGDGQQERPISVENCCGPWLLRLHSLRRLRLVLAVSSTRGATHGSATKTMSSCDTKGKTSRGAVETGRHCRNSSGSASSDGNCEGWLDNRGQSNRMVAETSGDVRSAKLPEVSDPRDEHPGRGDNGDEDCDYVGGDDWCSGQHAAGASTTAQSVKPLVASGWVHSQLADLVMGYLPHCQCEIVRVRLD
ncbi:hypothetical protein Vretimale_457 [Volvox reticuliferus]|uniref:Uncharacterized protein n=1 Tax=Volvox reticuliferus TaxID=1737510 RepID=A0A8J4BZ62_9CHLO|nr:hypothetical protein Vretifemale_2465 [Volvox reticuliferus]GIL94223.1 hypothetical protein Vretimale_457 [Volvox reticuliferus]